MCPCRRGHFCPHPQPPEPPPGIWSITLEGRGQCGHPQALPLEPRTPMPGPHAKCVVALTGADTPYTFVLRPSPDLEGGRQMTRGVTGTEEWLCVDLCTLLPPQDCQKRDPGGCGMEKGSTLNAAFPTALVTKRLRILFKQIIFIIKIIHVHCVILEKSRTVGREIKEHPHPITVRPLLRSCSSTAGEWRPGH